MTDATDGESGTTCRRDGPASSAEHSFLTGREAAGIAARPAESCGSTSLFACDGLRLRCAGSAVRERHTRRCNHAQSARSATVHAHTVHGLMTPTSFVLTAMLLVPAVALAVGAQARPTPVLYRAAAQPSVTIGDGDDPTTILDQIVQVQRTRGGDLLVATYRDRFIHRFDSRGRPLRPIGRAGGGRGEFGSSPEFTLLPGDSIAALANGQITVFSPAGK